MTPIRRFLAAAALLVTAAAPARAQDAGGGLPEIGTTLHLSPFETYRRVFHAFTSAGYHVQVGLIDRGLLISLPQPSADTAFKGLSMQMGAQLQPVGDSTHVTVSGRMVDAQGQPTADAARTMAPVLVEAMKVAAAIGGVGEKGDSVAAPASPQRHGFGYDSTSPIKVGGGVGGAGHQAQEAYLARLRGPGNRPVTFERLGSCCTFDRAGDPPKGRIDAWEVAYAGLSSPVVLYLSLYDTEAPRAPQGFTLR
ncbi:MAG: hypothetical protein JWM27_1622 [Gemmatimonadetes bacterium]|nr:hypothetical protein [Gemmatimonadota bacterium]